MMKSIGKKEIKEALDNIVLNGERYEACQIDSMILNYYNFPEDTLLEDVTKESHDFGYIADVYDYIDKLLNEKGYVADDLDSVMTWAYVKRSEDDD